MPTYRETNLPHGTEIKRNNVPLENTISIPKRKIYRLGDKDRRSAEICGAYDRSSLALKLKPLFADKAKKQQGTRTDISQKSVKSNDTQKELAKVAGVSHDTPRSK